MSRFLPPEWVAPYVGLPWKPHGRVRAGLDCWGLYRLVAGEMTGVWLPSYAERYASPAERAEVAAIIREETANDWFTVDRPQPLDGALFRSGGRHESHIAVVLSPRFFLHMIGEEQSKIGRFDDPEHADTLKGFRRHPLVAGASPWK